MKKFRLFLVVVFFGWTTPVLPAFVGNWSFLNVNGPYQLFNEKDFEIFKASTAEALDNQKDGETISWENPLSGANGTHRIVRSFSRDNNKCRRLEMLSRAGSRQSRIAFNFCVQPDGSWGIAR